MLKKYDNLGPHYFKGPKLQAASALKQPQLKNRIKT
jgi:hypothetical protein